MKKTIVLVGCGHMGAAMLRGWIGDLNLDAKLLYVIDPKAEQLEAQYPGAAHFGNSPSIVPQNADALVFALKPQKFKDILPEYQKNLGSNSLVISIAAGTRIDQVAQYLSAPSTAIVRAMPNLPAQIGQGISGAFANKAVTGKQKDLAQQLLSSLGEVIWVDDEKYMNAITATSGSGPAYVFKLCEVMAAAGVKSGLPADLALALAKKTITGSARILENTIESPGELRRAVTSPGGTTAAALEVLDDKNALQDLFDRAIGAAAARGKTLSEN